MLRVVKNDLDPPPPPTVTVASGDFGWDPQSPKNVM